MSSGESGNTVIFLGAGASHCCGIPLSNELSKAILQIQKFRPELLRLRERFQKNGVRFNTETLLTYLEASSNRRTSFLDAGATLLGLTPKDRCFDLDSVPSHADLANQIKVEIRNRCYVGANRRVKFAEATLREHYSVFLSRLVKNKKLGLKAELPHKKPKYPNLEFFTTNYDDVLEKFFASEKIETIDGYAETVGPPQSGNDQTEKITFRFDEDEFDDPNFPRVYKLFGCIMYARQGEDIVRIEPYVWPYVKDSKDGVDLLIYPGATKIIWTEPQLQLFHRFHNRLRHATNCIVVGYSFHDRAVNDIFTNALALNPALHIYCVCGKYTKKTIQPVFGKSRNVTPIPKNFEHFDPLHDIR